MAFFSQVSFDCMEGRIWKWVNSSSSSLRVPVLSKTIQSAWARPSMSSPDFEMSPRVDNFHKPLQMAMGVARPRAQGQATSRTAMLLKRASVQVTRVIQNRKVNRDTIIMMGKK